MNRRDLARRILAALERGGDRAALAVAIHRWQHAHDPVLRALIPEPAPTASTIPAVPVGLFRDLDVGTVRPEEPHVLFLTSGTTSGRPGRHRLRDTALYDAGCLRHAARWLPTDTRYTLALLPDRPTSSLAHMIRLFEPITGPVRFLVDDDGLHLGPLAAMREPVFLCATAFALDAWLETSPPPLPKGSAIMITGGFKGRTTTLDEDALIAAASARAPVVLEYGMTELSSQLWARPGERYQPPWWLEVVAVDPATGRLLPPGEAGQLRFLDLCNLDSTVRIETLDRGIVHGDGTVELLGRLTGAPARGCSLTFEALG